jgi:hypothetical protein
VRGSSWTADSDQDFGVLEERLDDVPMVLFGRSMSIASRLAAAA